MRALVSLSEWRWPHWMVFVVGLLWLAVYGGIAGQFNETVEELARHPRAAQWFNDPTSGNREALIILLVFAFTAPVVSMIVAGIVITLARLMAAPIGRLIHSERLGTLALLVALAGFLYVQSPAWWPEVRPYAAVIARAYLVSWSPASHVVSVPVPAPAAATEAAPAPAPYGR